MRETPSWSKAPLSRACVLWSNQSAVLVFDLSHQSGLCFMAACQSFSICACQDGARWGAQRGGGVADKRGNSCPRHDIVPTVDCLSPLPMPCLPACSMSSLALGWFLMKSFQFHIIHAPQQPSLHSLLLLLHLLLLCLPATPPCAGFAVEWRLHSLLLFLVFYVFFSLLQFLLYFNFAQMENNNQDK